MEIAIVVASATGRTRRMAEALADGVREAGGCPRLVMASAASAADVTDAAAVVLGSGVHMAGVESEMRGFLERLSPLWLAGGLAGKLGAAFVSSGTGGQGGAELALISLHAALAQHGMLLISMPNRSQGFSAGGSHWGPVAWTNPRGGEAGPTADHLAAARAHGRHITECARRWGVD